MKNASASPKIGQDAVAALKASLRGPLIEPGDPEFDAARRVYNAMIDKRPRLIIRCADVADVLACVRFARERTLPLAVRGGGHNGARFGTCEDCLLVDLGGMKGIRVDPAAKTIRVEAGCIHRDVDHAAHAFGLAVPAGAISSTGIAGLTLGGGHGYLSRKYGLTVDNLLEADVVLADGRLVTAGPDVNSDLFWAIRGGGGNFGIVTSFLFKARPVDTVLAGPMLWGMDQAAEVMRWYRRFIVDAPEDIYAFLALMHVPPSPHFPQELHQRKVCSIVWCCLGDPAAAQSIFKPLRAALPPLLEMVGQMPFPALQSMFDPLLPPGLQWYWKGSFVGELPDAAIAVHLEHAAKAPTPLSLMHLYPINGAVHRVSGDATAFSYRDATWSMVIAGISPDPADGAAIRTWARSYWEALKPYSLGAGYVNFMMEEDQRRVELTYRGNYPRLAALKRKYDPDNLFRVNQNITPAG